MKKIKQIADKLRMPVWWYHIVPPIVSVIYAVAWIAQVSLQEIWLPTILFCVSVMTSAAFGYWLNDCTDVQEDLQAGKINHAAGLTIIQRFLVLVILAIIGLLPWLFLPPVKTAWCALGLLFVCFFLYSMPPFRFKNRALLGVLCDIHYGHVLPIIITVATFGSLYSPFEAKKWNLIIILLILLYIKGFRNITEHQINDRKNDRKNGVYTFVIAIKPLNAARLLSFVLVPIELSVIALFLVQWSVKLLITYLLFLALYAFLLQRWGVFRLPLRHRWYKFWYIANDFYESWLPISILFLASLDNWQYLILLLIHLVLFSKNIQWFGWIVIEFKSIFFITHNPTKSLT